MHIASRFDALETVEEKEQDEARGTERGTEVRDVVLMGWSVGREVGELASRQVAKSMAIPVSQARSHARSTQVGELEKQRNKYQVCSSVSGVQGSEYARDMTQATEVLLSERHRNAV